MAEAALAVSLRIFFTVVLAVLIRLGVDLAGHWIAWWAAGLIAAIVVFGGLLLLDGDDDWFR